jgi:hypothetical protein
MESVLSLSVINLDRNTSTKFSMSVINLNRNTSTKFSKKFQIRHVAKASLVVFALFHAEGWTIGQA